VNDRPDEHSPDAAPARYRQPGRDDDAISAENERAPTTGARRGIGATLAGLGVLALKFKAVLLALWSFKSILILGKLGWSFGSIFVSVWLYAIFWGWKFACAFVLLLVIHEFGHWYAAKSLGLRASLPMLVPLLGAFTRTEMPRSGVASAIVTLGGPLAGIIGSAICYAYGVATGNPFWHAVAYVGFLINAFNLIPVLPLDGGAIAGILSPRLWLIGVVALVAFIAVTGSFSSITTLIILVLVVLSVPRAIAAWRGTTPPPSPDLTPLQRGSIAAAYFLLLSVSGIAAVASYVAPAVRMHG